MTLPVNGSGPTETRSSGISANALAERLVEAAAYLHHQKDARDIARYVSILAGELVPAANGVTVSAHVESLHGCAVLGVIGYPHLLGTMIIDDDSDMGQTMSHEFMLRDPVQIANLFTAQDDDTARRFMATESMGIRHRGLMGMPMYVGDRQCGAMWIGHWMPNSRFTANDRTKIRLLAQIAALAFDDARYATIYRTDGQSIRVPIHETTVDDRSANDFADGSADGATGLRNAAGPVGAEPDRADGSAADIGAGPIPEFTERELSVLKLIGAGLTSREIADQLFISVNTVRTHRTNLLGKLNVHSSPAAVAKARELGLLH